MHLACHEISEDKTESSRTKSDMWRAVPEGERTETQGKGGACRTNAEKAGSSHNIVGSLERDKVRQSHMEHYYGSGVTGNNSSGRSMQQGKKRSQTM